LAQELHADLVLLDDLKAREEAERRACAVMGTLRVLELVSERGLLDFSVAMTNWRPPRFICLPNWCRRCLLAMQPGNDRCSPSEREWIGSYGSCGHNQTPRSALS
jgi:hypothetical protein